jgi:hypothetical protein
MFVFRQVYSVLGGPRPSVVPTNSKSEHTFIVTKTMRFFSVALVAIATVYAAVPVPDGSFIKQRYLELQHDCLISQST